MANDILIKDLQEIAADAALLVEGKNLDGLSPPEKRLVALLAKRQFLTESKKGFVGQARRTDHK